MPFIFSPAENKSHPANITRIKITLVRKKERFNLEILVNTRQKETLDKFVVLFNVYNMSHLYEPEMNASQVKKLIIIELF